MKIRKDIATGEVTVTISRVEMETGEVCVANAAWRDSYWQFLRALSEEIDSLVQHDERSAAFIQRNTKGGAK